jgi:SagB-type dehydrogenase family enzyme
VIMLEIDDVWSLPLLYHLNSEPWVNEEAAIASAGGRIGGSVPGHCPDVKLPTLNAGDAVGQAILSRRSVREFGSDPVPLSDVADALGLAYGAGELIAVGDGRSAFSHPVPSAGGLYPLRLLVATGRVYGIDPGLYRYRPFDHALDRVGSEPTPADLSSLMLGQSFLEAAGAVVLIVAVFERTLSKYGPRGYRYCLLEAGHVAQNFCLAAESRGLKSVCLGGFSDTRLNAALNLDGKREAVVYAVATGVAASVRGSLPESV